ncbi:conserved protein of unknown function (plasmid) [Cupriavidus taiwanensis]|uniref:Uncharacterized protein n=1 Tax=Cupriavidus taiwanensis TaxID=164546 RepID=A0A9Q7XQA2_9BURK|nr:hypothetical protein [Cupriavidus taiwanensis]SPD66683.1 conserved protein of unknown function [Cupriavidus taiwanensis]
MQAKAKGRVVWALPAAQQFFVDAEAALLIAPIEFDPLEVYDAGIAPGQVTAGFRWYAQYGDRLGLTLEGNALCARSLPFESLPPKAGWPGRDRNTRTPAVTCSRCKKLQLQAPNDAIEVTGNPESAE